MPQPFLWRVAVTFKYLHYYILRWMILLRAPPETPTNFFRAMQLETATVHDAAENEVALEGWTIEFKKDERGRSLHQHLGSRPPPRLIGMHLHVAFKHKE